MNIEGILAPAANPHLFGHKTAEKILLDAWNGGKFPHAVMLVGRRGIGKATLAYRLARFVFSEGTGSGGLFAGEAPDQLAVPVESPVFAQVAARSRTDLRIADLLADWETQKYDDAIGIDRIRELSAFFRLTAAQGGWRVAVIDAVDDMTLAASNSLLKILEEPPPQCLLILVCHSLGSALPTIRSRCFRISLSPLPVEEVRRVLDAVRDGDARSGQTSREGTYGEDAHNGETHGGEAHQTGMLDNGEREIEAQGIGTQQTRAHGGDADPEALQTALELAEGSPGDVLTFLEGDGAALYAAALDLIEGAAQPASVDIGPIVRIVADRNRPGNFPLFCRLMDAALARLVLCSAGRERAVASCERERDVFSRALPGGTLAQWYEVWEKTAETLTQTRLLNLDRGQAIASTLSIIGAATR